MAARQGYMAEGHWEKLRGPSLLRMLKGNGSAYNLATLPVQQAAVVRQAMQEQEVLEMVAASLAAVELKALQELPASVQSACS